MSKFGEAMRGLTVFISDIRNCKSKEAERKRVNKELANIRSKFKGDKIDGYQKKKYVCKLMFIFLLGYDVNFGYQEAVNLLSSIRFSEKQIGYLFVSVVMGDDHDLMPLVIKAIRYDLESRNPIFNTLAMQCIANIANRDMVEQLGKDAIPNLLTSPDTNANVKQTACLCLLKLIRVDSKIIPIEQHASRIMRFLNDKHLGLVTAACSLLQELAHTHTDAFQGCVSDTITKLAGIVTKSHSDVQDYTYYFVPAPWLCVKLMKLLQCYPVPNDPIVKARLQEALDAILNRATESSKSKKVQHSNAKNAVMFEAINLIVHQSDNSLQVRACNLLGSYLTHKDTNMRYLSLDGLCNLCTSDFSQEAVRKHQDVVVNTLKTERDISVRQKAIDLLYAMCDHSNAQTIVGELLQYLETADFSVREPLVLKIAILAEKYAQDYTWYVDTILNLIRLAGDYVSEEVWYRIIQIVINKQEVQGYSAKTCFEALQAPACHENMIKVGGYILGEFGNLIAGDPRSGPIVQFQLLHSKFPFCSLGTRALLLSTYIKFINLYPEIKQHIQDILSQDSQSRNADLELQQRAIEYLKMSHIASHDLMATILEEMPQFPEKDSLLLSKLYKTAPWMAKLHDSSGTSSSTTVAKEPPAVATATSTAASAPTTSTPAGGAITGDLLSVDVTPAPVPTDVSILGDVYATVVPKSARVAQTAGASPKVANASPKPGSASPDFTLTPGAEDGYKRLYTKNSGVLFENTFLQIGIKSEFKKNLGRFGIFYGNKNSSSLLNCSADVIVPDDSKDKLNVQVNAIPTNIDAGAQVQQVINVECTNIFTESPLLIVFFSVSGAPHRLVLKLPAMLYKFSEPAVMDSTQFFSRWKQLSSPAQEVQTINSAKHGFDRDAIETKLKGFGLSVLSGIDPNPDNFVSASIINTSTVLVGCLIRLEPNNDTQQYRLTIRTSHEEVSKLLNRLLSEQF